LPDALFIEDTAIVLPEGIGDATLRSEITSEEVRLTDGTIRIARVLAKLPAAVLTN
jgi:hypothetical protein